MELTLELAALVVALGANIARAGHPWARFWRYLLYSAGHAGVLIIVFSGRAPVLDSLAIGLCVMMLAAVLGAILSPVLGPHARLTASILLVSGAALVLVGL